MNSRRCIAAGRPLRRAYGMFPPPWRGRVRVGGLPRVRTCEIQIRGVPPPPTPPRKGEGSPAWSPLRVAIGVAIFAGAAATAFAQSPPPAQPPARLTIGFIEIEGDARHEPIRPY